MARNNIKQRMRDDDTFCDALASLQTQQVDLVHAFICKELAISVDGRVGTALRTRAMEESMDAMWDAAEAMIDMRVVGLIDHLLV